MQQLSLDWNDMVFDGNGDPTGWTFGNLWVNADRGVDASGPVDTVRIAGFVHIEDFVNQTTRGFPIPQQSIAAEDFVMDPAGNSATIETVAYEDPTTQTGAHAIQLTFTQPTTTYIAHPDTHNPGVNAYTDPSGATGASAWTQVGLNRFGYTIAGSLDGDPFVASSSGCGGTCIHAWGSTFSGLNVNPSVVLP
jgi:hypothetical protein